MNAWIETSDGKRIEFKNVVITKYPTFMPETIAQEARRLRNEIYGTTPEVTDERWSIMEEKWVEDIRWLREQAKRERKNENGK